MSSILPTDDEPYGGHDNGKDHSYYGPTMPPPDHGYYGPTSESPCDIVGPPAVLRVTGENGIQCPPPLGLRGSGRQDNNGDDDGHYCPSSPSATSRGKRNRTEEASWTDNPADGNIHDSSVHKENKRPQMQEEASLDDSNDDWSLFGDRGSDDSEATIPYDRVRNPTADEVAEAPTVTHASDEEAEAPMVAQATAG